jgi:lysophospholipid acyltransferase 1/2
MLSRLKYYVAWHLGEAISNASGLGFNGYESNGEPKWNLISNMNLWKFETCLNFREAIHAWNKTTQSWLRRTAYERAPRRLSVLATYLLSAVWHGFYPGYYMTFLGGALFTYGARNGRNFVRPLFQKGKLLPKLYDIITFVLTRVAIAYVAFPFVILDFRNNYEIYKSLYFSIHAMAFGGILLGFFAKKKKHNVT